MGVESRQLVLGDFFTLQRGTTYKSRLLGQPGPTLLGLGTIQRDGGFRSDSLRTYGGESPQKLLVQPGELYVSLKDVTQSADLLGAVARLPRDQSVGRLTQDTVKLELKDSDAPIDYLYWVLRTPQYRNYCRAHATGTTNLGLAREDFLAFPVPPLSKQRQRIAELLNALDDKIELNRRSNETLEAMARALFKDWFVDFGPVRAKLEGREPYLAPKLWAMFPDALNDEGLPEGWSREPLAHFIELIGGGTPKTSEAAYWDGDIPWFSVVDAPSSSDVFVTRTQKSITERGLSSCSARLLPERATIISARGTVGKLAIVGSAMAMNQSCYAIVGLDDWGPYFVYFMLKNAVQQLQANTHGSVFDTITRKTFDSVFSSRPDPRISAAFESAVMSWMERIKANSLESETLVSLRDTLLPKLLSGEPCVPDAESEVTEAL